MLCGVQEVTAQLELEALADGRRWGDERQHNNQPDKRRKRGMMRCGSAMRGGGAGGCKAAA